MLALVDRQKVYVRSGSSYASHLTDLNRSLSKGDLPPIKILEAEGILGTEDILEMVHAGLVKLTVADHHIAKAWAQVLPNIRLFQ